MYVDKLLEFSDAQAVTVAAASTNVIDTSVLRDLGVGQPLYIVVQVAVVLTDTHDVAVVLQGHDDDQFGATATIQTVGTIAGGSAVGTRLVQALQPAATWYRYIRLYYTPADTITGSLDAFITNEAGVQKIYGSGFSVG